MRWRAPVAGCGLCAALVLAACGAAGASKGAANAAPGQGNFIFAPLKLDDMAIGLPGGTNSGTPGFDGTSSSPGNMVDGSQFPGGGKKQVDTWSVNSVKVPFQWPGSTGMDAVGLANAQSAKVAVPAGKYQMAYFLEAAGYGPATVDITPVYSTGPGTQQQVKFSDWCAASPSGSREILALQPTDRLNATGSSISPACGFWVHWLALNKAKTLTGFTVENDPSSAANSVAVIPALTLEKA